MSQPEYNRPLEVVRIEKRIGPGLQGDLPKVQLEIHGATDLKIEATKALVILVRNPDNSIHKMIFNEAVPPGKTALISLSIHGLLT